MPLPLANGGPALTRLVLRARSVQDTTGVCASGHCGIARSEGRLGRSLISARADPLPECDPEVAVRNGAHSGDPAPEYDR
jgi:hypothetical protein